MFEDDVTDKR
ncbi:Protein of unknown function [Bacillus cereus]|nr:Protein of unknown function [Bacillus cereus]